MDISSKIFSDIIVFMKYARYIPRLKRRETWEEIVTRNMEMHIRKYPELETEIRENYKYVFDKKVLPSMRSLQFGGKPIEIMPQRIFNCSACAIDHPDVFSEIMFLLLSGCGVGISVQKHHVKKLPAIIGPMHTIEKHGRKKRYLVGDSIEGWADCIKVLIESYFYGKKEIEFDFRDIRPKGARLITAGGKAPGPEPLAECVKNIRKVLDNSIAERGMNTKLKPIEAHDIACFVADAVLSGGIRRSAMISLFSFNDEEMMNSKNGNWWEQNPQRARANNSVLIIRHKIKKEDFYKLWERIKKNGTGEPGILFSHDKDWLTNPCSEVAMRSNSFCNLTTINVGDIENQEDLNNRSKAASFIGTLQAGYMNYHYLRDEWEDTVEKEALLGVSMTGISSGEILKYDIKASAEIVLKENERVAKSIGINRAARTTLVKPEGTSSSVLGTSSGVHAWHSPYYIRRVRIGKNESLYAYLKENCPEILEDEYFNPDTQSVISFPIKSPENAIYRNEYPIAILERVKKINLEWIRPGHRKGSNYNNVSVTVTYNNDEEYEDIGNWMWENKEFYNGISVFPADNGTYKQAPFEECTKEEYERLYGMLKDINLKEVWETEDGTSLKEESACAGGACTITSL